MSIKTHLKHGVNALPLRVPHGTQPVTGQGAAYHPGHVGDDEAHRAPAQTAHDTPELARRLVGAGLRHALLAQHLLEHVGELRVLRLLARLAVGALAGEVVPCPGVGALGRARAAAGGGGTARRFWFVGGEGLVGGVGVGKGVGVGLPRAAEELALGVVLAAPGGIRQGVVGVVDYLELARAGGALGGVLGDAVWVGFEGGSGMGVLVVIREKERWWTGWTLLLVCVADLGC